MSYKVLLAGKNNAVMDDFFSQMSDAFEAVTTSTRYDDILRHIHYFEPDLFIYCINQEVKERMMRIAAAENALKEANIPFALIGSNQDCSTFVETVSLKPDLTLIKPLSLSTTKERIQAFLDDKKQKEKEEAMMAEVRAALAATKSDIKAVQEAKEASRRKHILVVDDDPMMLKVLKEHLHTQYDVATAINGKVALKFLENKKTDLILLDYEMPVENGVVVLEKLRANEATSGLPVIFLTGVTEKEKISKVLSLKPQGYLLKPIDKDKLFDAINAVFRRKIN